MGLRFVADAGDARTQLKHVSFPFRPVPVPIASVSIQISRLSRLQLDWFGFFVPASALPASRRSQSLLSFCCPRSQRSRRSRTLPTGNARIYRHRALSLCDLRFFAAPFGPLLGRHQTLLS